LHQLFLSDLTVRCNNNPYLGGWIALNFALILSGDHPGQGLNFLENQECVWLVFFFRNRGRYSMGRLLRVSGLDQSGGDCEN